MSKIPLILALVASCHDYLNFNMPRTIEEKPAYSQYQMIQKARKRGRNKKKKH